MRRFFGFFDDFRNAFKARLFWPKTKAIAMGIKKIKLVSIDPTRTISNDPPKGPTTAKFLLACGCSPEVYSITCCTIFPCLKNQHSGLLHSFKKSVNCYRAQSVASGNLSQVQEQRQFLLPCATALGSLCSGVNFKIFMTH